MDYTDYDTRLAAYAVIVSPDDEVLLALWNEPERPLWTLPGGGVEWGEATVDGAVREVREETGYDVELTGILGVDESFISVEQRFIATDRPQRNVRVVYAARIVGGGLRDEVDGTTDEARWFPLAEVDALPHVDLVDAGLAFWRAAHDR